MNEIIIKTPEEIEKMRELGKLVGTILIFSRREFLNKNRAFLDFLASKFII